VRYISGFFKLSRYIPGYIKYNELKNEAGCDSGEFMFLWFMFMWFMFMWFMFMWFMFLWFMFMWFMFMWFMFMWFMFMWFMFMWFMFNYSVGLIFLYIFPKEPSFHTYLCSEKLTKACYCEDWKNMIL